jgi:lipoprotein
MRKGLIWVALASLTFALSACGKSGKEPVPPTPTPTPPSNEIGKVDENDTNGQKALAAPIYFRIPKGTSFRLRVRGVGDLTLIGAKSSTQQYTYTAGDGGIVGIEGALDALEIITDGITEFKVAKPTSTLKRITLLTAAYGTLPVSSIDLTNAPELTYLWLAGHELNHLDLTKQTKLKELGLGSYNTGLSNFNGKERSSNYKKVSLPVNNVLEVFISRSPLTNQSMDLDNLPKIKQFRAQSPSFTKVSFDKSRDLEVLVIDRPSGGGGFSLELENMPRLKDVTLRDTHVTTAKLHNLPSLGEDSNITIAVGTKELDLAGIPQAMLPVLLDRFSPATVEKLDVTGADVTTLDVSKFAMLTALDVKGTGLSEAELVKTISQLTAPSGQLEIEVARLTANVQTALTTKGWTAKTN